MIINKFLVLLKFMTYVIFGKIQRQKKKMKDEKDHLLGLTFEELQERMGDWGVEKYRAKQIYRWAFRKRVSSFREMSNLPRDLKRLLSRKLSFTLPSIEKTRQSNDGSEKFLLKLDDGKFIETVSIPEPKRITICISSQVGCSLSCRFCLTGKMKFERNLTPEEMTAQALLLLGERLQDHKRINIVLMGMGEPLNNYDNVLKFIRIISHQEGLQITKRRITLSTVGIVPKIYDLSLEDIRPKLAVSLNATTNQLRSRLMPINKKYNIGSLLKACQDYFLKTSERITFEYILFDKLNDSLTDVRRLVKLLHGTPARVNVVPFNEERGMHYKKPSEAKITKFREALIEKGIDATTRKSRGADIHAACGQLLHSRQANA